MKKLFLTLCALATMSTAFAQTHFPSSSNPDVHFPIVRHHEEARTNIVVPGLYGYNVYRADLHNHTIYSDANVTPAFRVREAWMDGLDVIAVTDHLECRNLEVQMIDYMKKYLRDEVTEAVNARVFDVPDDGRPFMTDQNYPITLAQKEAEKYGITVIPGTEISRNPNVAGHFNALFTTDLNTVYDRDPKKSLLKAKAQGALIMHNHPGWRLHSVERIPFAQEVYDEGIIDGVEVMNGRGFHTKALDWANEYDLFITSNSDAHYSTHELYGVHGVLRNMTLIFAKDKSLDSLKEAIKAHRTIACSFGIMAGGKQILEDFFKASVQFEVLSTSGKGTRMVSIKNNTSLEYIIRLKGNPVKLPAFENIVMTAGDKENLVVTVENMWYSTTEHPVITIEL